MDEAIRPADVDIPAKMRAMRIHRLGPISASGSPLQRDVIATPRPQNSEILIRVQACGVCHTELDELEGRAAPPVLPMIPGHQVVGTVIEEAGPRAHRGKLSCGPIRSEAGVRIGDGRTRASATPAAGQIVGRRNAAHARGNGGAG